MNDGPFIGRDSVCPVFKRGPQVIDGRLPVFEAQRRSFEENIRACCRQPLANISTAASCLGYGSEIEASIFPPISCQVVGIRNPSQPARSNACDAPFHSQQSQFCLALSKELDQRPV